MKSKCVFYHLTCFLFVIIAAPACEQKQIKPNIIADQNAKNKLLVEQYFDYFNKHNWEAMAALYADTSQHKDPAYGLKPVNLSKADIVKKYKELEGFIPNVKDSIINIYYAEKNVTVEFISQGKAVDNSNIYVPICTVFEIINDKVVKDYTYYDNMEGK